MRVAFDKLPETLDEGFSVLDSEHNKVGSIEIRKGAIVGFHGDKSLVFWSPFSAVSKMSLLFEAENTIHLQQKLQGKVVTNGD